MTSTTCAATAAAARPPLVTRALLMRFAAVVGATGSFFLLLSVVPLYATTSGGDAGLATGALMFTTVCGELATPRLVARFGYRAVVGAGLVLMGAPALALTASGSMAWIVLVCLARGLGFGLAVVAGGALSAELIPAERRGEGLALFGVVSAAPSLVGLPLGVWLATHAGYTPVCVAGGVVALAAVAVLPGIPARAPASGDGVEKRPPGATDRTDTPDGLSLPAGPAHRPAEGDGPVDGHRDGPGDGHGDRHTNGHGDALGVGDVAAPGVVAGLRTGALVRPTVVFATTALGAGIVVTFLPLAVPDSASGLVAAALFLQPAATAVARWFAGRAGDRLGPARLVLPGLLLAAGGLLVTAMTGSALAVLGGVTLFGAGFGVMQNATLSLMYARVSAAGFGTVSALWNVAFDAGMGVGALGYGPVAALTGYPTAFALSAALTLLAVVPAWRDRRVRGLPA